MRGRSSLFVKVDASGPGNYHQIEIPSPRQTKGRLTRLEPVGMSHNLAVVYHNGSFVFVGGTVQYRQVNTTASRVHSTTKGGDSSLPRTMDPDAGVPSPRASIGAGMRSLHRGIWLARSRSLWFAQAETQAYSSWSELRNILDGQHEGCIENRDASMLTWLVPSVCEYDGRLSLAYFRGRFFLFARANPASQGGRFVQVTTSEDSTRWSPFRMIHILGYSHTEGNVYFWAVQAAFLDCTFIVHASCPEV